jgi:hypothetical protein
MPKQYLKIKECGCIVKAISCGIKVTDNGNMYVLGGHNHYTICDKCKEDETDNDTLYDMWMNDNLTNELEYAGWKEHK